jgi:hypothetical protein
MRPVLLTQATLGPVLYSDKPVVALSPLRPVQSDHSTLGRGQLFQVGSLPVKLASAILLTLPLLPAPSHQVL